MREGEPRVIGKWNGQYLGVHFFLHQSFIHFFIIIHVQSHCWCLRYLIDGVLREEKHWHWWHRKLAAGRQNSWTKEVGHIRKYSENRLSEGDGLYYYSFFDRPVELMRRKSSFGWQCFCTPRSGPICWKNDNGDGAERQWSSRCRHPRGMALYLSAWWRQWPPTTCKIIV